LRAGKFREHRQSDMITRICPVSYDPAATCPRWLQFLDETFPDDRAIIAFLQRSLGYTLTSDISEQCFWLLIGAGKNGKSVFLATVEHILGSYAVSTSFDVFADKPKGAAINPRDGLAALVGSRFVRASESDEERRFSEAQLKALTGGEKVRTAKMYEDDFQY